MESEATTYDTSAIARTLEESNLALQSPVLAQSPLLAVGAPSQIDDVKAVGSMKRSRADMATPRKPGTAESRAQEITEFIDTPARAPPAMKRLMRDGSPVSRRASLELNSPNGLSSLPLEQESGRSLVSATQSLSVAQADAVVSPPKFSLAMGEFGSDMAVDEPEPQSLLVMASSDNSTDDPFSIGSISISQAPASPDTSWLKTPQRQSQDAETTVVKEETVATTLFEKVGAEPMAKSPSEKEKAEFKA
ncbi:hypothetical protein GGI22_003232, partial [Coemansia erecta]